MAYVDHRRLLRLAGGHRRAAQGQLVLALVPDLRRWCPFFGLLAAIAYRFERDELRRACPSCGRVTKIYDALCTRCGTELDFPEVGDRARVLASGRREPHAARA